MFRLPQPADFTGKTVRYFDRRKRGLRFWFTDGTAIEIRPEDYYDDEPPLIQVVRAPIEVEPFFHPVSGSVIVGTRVLSGTKLEGRDFYDSTSGRWEPCPCVGQYYEQPNSTIWVRPEQ